MKTKTWPTEAVLLAWTIAEELDETGTASIDATAALVNSVIIDFRKRRNVVRHRELYADHPEFRSAFCHPDDTGRGDY